MKIYTKAITHAGIFHADDVFSTALMKMLCPEITVSRVTVLPEDCTECIVYDIGGGKFDHHIEIKRRENGRRYAAFGLLWKEYGEYICGSEKAMQQIDEKFVSVIDEADNGGEKDTVSIAISAFNPSWNSSENTDEAFEKAVDTAYKILSRIIRRECSVYEADGEVKKAFEVMSDGIVILSRFAPWESTLVGTDAVFVIFPSMRGGYNIQGIPVVSGSKEVRIPFPENWCGLENAALDRASGMDGMIFCHKNGFIASASTLECAVSAARKVIESRR